jgi:hypothetical protein
MQDPTIDIFAIIYDLSKTNIRYGNLKEMGSAEITASLQESNIALHMLGTPYLGKGRAGLSIARKIVGNFLAREIRLYEQESLHTRVRRLGEYVPRRVTWVSLVIAWLETRSVTL